MAKKPNPLPDRKALDDIVFDILGLTREMAGNGRNGNGKWGQVLKYQFNYARVATNGKTFKNRIFSSSISYNITG